MTTQLGPYELNQIYCGECSAMMEQLPDGCIDLTVTSPPYDNQRSYHGYTFDFEAVARQLHRVTKPGGIGVWVVGSSHNDFNESLTPFKQAIHFVEVTGFNLVDTMIYYRFFPTWNETRKTYRQYFEYCFVLSKGKPETFNPIRDVKTTHRTERTATLRHLNGSKKTEVYQPNDLTARGNVWWYDNGFMKTTKDTEAFDHPAIFPEQLAHDHIISWSNPGDVVLDPFMGSGTVAKMAAILGRHYLGFEISEQYTQLARQRVANIERELRGEWRTYEARADVDTLPLFAGMETTG